MYHHDLRFFTIAKSCDIWKNISSVIMNVTNEAQFEVGPKGIEFRSKNPSCEALIDVTIPSVVFQFFHCPASLKFGIRISEFLKIIKRIEGNLPVEVYVQDKSLVVAANGTYFSCYNLNLIESKPPVSPLQEMTFHTKLVIGTETLADILDDIQVFSGKLNLKTVCEPEIATTFTGVSDRGSAVVIVTKNNGIRNIQQHTSMVENTEGTYSLCHIADLLDSIGAITDYVQLEYSSGRALRLKFHFESVTVLLYVANHI
jgi:proliferating cell nuclear antigen